MILDTIIKGARASVTLDNLNLSNTFDTSRTGVGAGRIPLTGGQHATYEQLYRTQPWVQASVNRVARGVGRLPLHSYIDGGRPGERERQRDGYLVALLERPYPGGTPSSWKQSIVTNLLLHGNSIDVKMRAGIGLPPSSLVPSSFAFWRPVYNKGVLDWWVFDGGDGTRIPYRPEEVIHYHPWPLGRGVVAPSPLEALRSTLMIEDAAQRAAISAFEHGMRPPGAYSVDGQLDPSQMKELRAYLDEVYGGPDNMTKVLLLDNGAKWQALSSGSLVDSEIINLRKMTREEVLAVVNLPQPSAGVLDRATFSNITEQHLMEYQDTYGPWTTLIEETIAVELIATEPTMVGQYVEFNFKEVMKGDPLKEMDALQKAVGGPYMTPNEARATQNLPPLDGGDELNPSPNQTTQVGEPA